jgi:hypothetical protein
MDEGEDKELSGGRGSQISPAAFPKFKPDTSFDRREMNTILSVYGRNSIFRRSSEMPLYRIVKKPQLARRQGAYAVLAAGGRILRRGHDLRQVLFAIDRGPKLVKA